MSPVERKKAGAVLWMGLVLAWLVLGGAFHPGDSSPRTSPGLVPQSGAREPEALTKARAYCRRLQFASLDFVCREQITEVITNPESGGETLDSFNLRAYKVKGSTFKHRLVYDYQFVRKASLTKERRTLLEEDGVPKNIPNADLSTWTFHYANVLFGPAALLDDRNFSQYDFSVQGKETLQGEPAVILQARPKTAAGEKAVPFGRLWVAAGDGAVLKIEWDERTIGNYSAVETRAKEFKALPKLTMTSEFGLVKNGIRFPSRHTIVESYIKEKGKAEPFVRCRMQVEYVRYQFFTVETQVDFRKSPLPR